MNMVKGFFSGALGIVIFIASIILSGLILLFGIKVVTAIYPLLLNVNTISTYLSILILLPLAIFKKSRIVSVYGLLVASFIFGATLWVYSFLITFTYWGVLGLVIALFLAGIGVTPVALIASLFHWDWNTIGNIIYMLVLTFGARSLSLYLANKIDNEQNPRVDSNYIQEEDITNGTIVSSNNSGIDPLIDNAIDIVTHYDYVSAPLFQRKLSIGFERAINILNTLTIMNAIEGGEAEAPRKVLFNKDELQKVKNYFESLPKYDPSQFGEAEPMASIDERDSIYSQVKGFVKGKREITVADLQKKFDIGYSRGARIMDHLQEDGFVDSPIGNQPRKVLVAWQTDDPQVDLKGMMIVKTLKAFGLQTRIEEINKTRGGIEYCLEVAVGSSISGIEKLDKDIAMAVASPTGKVKIQAPIPGRSLIGITIPIKKT